MSGDAKERPPWVEREMEGMEAISGHCRRHGTPNGTTIIVRSPETGRLLRILIALYPEDDPRPRPVQIDRQGLDVGTFGWVPWLEARWLPGHLTHVRDMHGGDEEALDDDGREDLRAVVERLVEGIEEGES